MPDFGIFRGFNDKLFGNKLYAGQLPTQLGLIGSENFGFDVDAQAFFDRVTTAGGSLSITEKNAVNTLVVQMKTDGIWTKMKAIYPMVGASAAACAQNLKSSSFTGTFTAGWTFASNGITPNGTSAYMNSNFSPSNSIYDNFSWGYYLNTDITSDSSEFGVNNTTAFVYDYPKLDNNGYIRYASSERNYSGVNTLGFYTWNQQSNTLKRFKNGSLTNGVNNTPTNISAITLNYFIAARNNNGLPTNFSSRKRTFHFIGDGLTDTEASNFYTAVQAFQTTLSRQV